ncbi:MAG TPA: hypothetical protein VJ792_07620 [Candidatus Nitrosotalea sp.]|nr:hypothetical protein [Candidatus Nitrosotalea sp.]
MAFGGDVDTLSLTFDKLQYIFRGYDPIRESFLEALKSHKNRTLPDAEYFAIVEDAVRKFSALEFLAIKAVFEIKKASDRGTGVVRMDEITASAGQAQPPGHSISSFISPSTLPSHNIRADRSSGRSCKSCGNQLKPSASFCNKCGSKQ